jgi:anti-sigma factor RsiW
MTDHLEDELELYALGMLESHERQAVDAHVATCDLCLARLTEAEEVGASLAAVLPRHTPSPELSVRLMASLQATQEVTRLDDRRKVRMQPVWWMGAAAAFLLFIGQSWQSYQMGNALRSQDAVLATLVHSHFDHVNLTIAQPAPGFGAKAIYARNGNWMYLLVDHPPASVHVIVTSADGAEDLGALTPTNDVATLFLRPAHRITSIELITGGTPAASAKLIY